MADTRSEELPPEEIRRWIPRRKGQVVAAVRSGRLTLDEACERYEISPEEFGDWQRIVEEHGVSGLKLSGMQHRRQALQRPVEAVKRPGLSL